MIRFIAIHDTHEVIISDLPVEKLKLKFGHKFEILNAIGDKQHIDTIQQRLERTYKSYKFKQLLKKERKPHTYTPESKQRMLDAKLGKPRSAETKRKISEKNKGRSGFQGKRHTLDTRKKMADAKIGKQNINRGSFWIHNPMTGEEMRIKGPIPDGFKKGRDYYAREPLTLAAAHYHKNKGKNKIPTDS